MRNQHFKKTVRRQGNVMAVVIGILAVLFTAAVYFGSSTIDRTRQSKRALGGDQTASLAEAAVNRAIHIMSKAMNDPKSFDKAANIKNLAIMLRYPLPVKTPEANEANAELGKDDLLDISVMEKEGVPSKVELKLADLRIKPQGEDWLDEMIAYACADRAKSYDVTVTVEIEKACRINAKPLPSGKYEVPGIDCEFSVRKDVLGFLENKGMLNFILEFPDWLSLFNFSIPIKVWVPIVDLEITLATIDPAPIIDLAVKPLTKGSQLADAMNCPDGIGVKDYFVLDKILRALFHRMLDKPNLYPIKIMFDKDFFTATSDLWPSAVKVPEDYSRHVEKYGNIKISSVARIEFNDGTSSERRIEATKDFKVSDFMPMAPLYSFFMANATNDRVNFNDNGGQFYVNNSAGRIMSKDEREKRKETAGQIRVNFKPDDWSDTNPGTPLVINTSLMGHHQGPKLSGNGVANTAMNLAVGADGLLMLGRTKNAIISKASYNIDGTINSKNVNTRKGSPLPKELKFSRGPVRHGFQLSSDISAQHAKMLHQDPKYIENRKQYQTSALKQRNDSYKWWTKDEHKMAHEDYLKKKAESISFLPDPEKISSNIFSFGISMAIRAVGQSLNAPIGNGAVVLGSNPPADAFARMKLPWMGTSNSYYCLPSLGWGQNKTHLFGLNAWYPTLSRDIEGMVAKRYRQWHVTIVGLFAKDRLPLLPFPPPWCFLPPVPVPFWFADQIINKYDYNMWFMKAYDPDDDTADAGMSMYDPEYTVNMPANFYATEQYAKKSNYFYADAESFVKDLPNRMVTLDGKKALQLNGITFIAGSLGTDSKPFTAPEGDTFYVTGKGMLVVSGNVSLGCSIKYLEEPEKPTVFSLIVRNGGLIVTNSGDFVIEGSVFTNRGLYVGSNTTLNIQGNWVTNEFAKHRMRGEVMVDYVASKLRPSLGSLHPQTGKYDPRRYNLALSSRWSAWKVD